MVSHNFKMGILRGPLLLAFVLGCAISAIASGRFSARLIADGAISFAFVPAIEMAAFAVVYVRRTRRDISFRRAADRFFAGNRPWLLWLVALAAFASILPPRQISPSIVMLVLLSALIPVAWSMVLDFRFSRDVLNRSAVAAVRDVALNRAIGWTAATAYFLGIAIWSEQLPELMQWALRLAPTLRLVARSGQVGL